MLDDIIFNVITDTTKKRMEEIKIKDDKSYLYQGSLQDYPWKKKIDDT